MSLYTADYARRIEGFPRVSGDEPADARSIPAGLSFSPRERG